MLIVPEALIASLVSPEDAFAAVEATFAAMARGDAYNFPVIREAVSGSVVRVMPIRDVKRSKPAR